MQCILRRQNKTPASYCRRFSFSLLSFSGYLVSFALFKTAHLPPADHILFLFVYIECSACHHGQSHGIHKSHAYYDALATEKDSAEDASESTGEDAETEKTEQASEAFLNKVKELLNDGKISEDDAKKLEKEFAKTDTEDGDIEDEMTESDAGNDNSNDDGTEAANAE